MPPLRQDLWPNPARVPPAPVASKFDTPPDPLVVLNVHVYGGCGGCAAPVEISQDEVLPVLPW
jgi:hypothetical protein